jgi:TatD DNase family protein
MIVETHVHLCDAKYDADREDMIWRAETTGVIKFINVSAEIAEARKTADFDRPGVYKALGLHPHNANEYSREVFEEIRGLFKSRKNIIAVGEIGLDYLKSTTPKEMQVTVFKKFLELAREFDLPVIIHSREAHADTYGILKEFDIKKRGIIHCFTGDIDTARRFTNDGFLIGIGGVITFPNAGVLRATVAQLPLDHIVLETDAPWLAPQQVRGQRNEPAYLKYIVSEISRIKGATEAEVEKVTTENAEKIFKI